jgi:hypothetical protein
MVSAPFLFHIDYPPVSSGVIGLPLTTGSYLPRQGSVPETTVCMAK